jgi:poly(hydroxyalkanoate) depolymerase family esterase
MNHTRQDLMRQATGLTQAGRLNEATAAIQRALSGTHAPDTAAPAWATGQRRGATSEASSPLVLDDCVFEVGTPAAVASPTEPRPAAPSGAEEFSWGSHTHGALTRRFKLYTPPGRADQPMALVVMLHGCTQNPDDFAVGTGMNERARTHGFCVLYPEQSKDANPSVCWNWFKHKHQQRGSGEPALIASMTQAVMQQHGIDPRRGFIAGLSAGGAMAAIVAAAYPEIYAAVGVHSGLPSGAASNVAEALMVMKSGELGIVMPGKGRHLSPATQGVLRPPSSVPTIVFHGDQDSTVHPRNGEQVIAAVQGSSAAQPRVEQGVSARGRRYTRSTRQAEHGRTVSEHWLVHGAGHAWSGGSATGSYTDGSGPDASAEMLRFFFEQRP